MSADPNVFLDYIVGITTTDEGTEQVTAARGDVEESGLEGSLQVEARIKDVADGCKERVHVPDQRRRCEGLFTMSAISAAPKGQVRFSR